MTREERRRFQRVQLLQQVRGRVGTVRVFVADASVNGLRLVHRDKLVPAGADCPVAFDWEGTTVELACVLRHTSVRRPAKSAYDTPLYESGVEIIKASERSMDVLKQMIEWHVLRALDEQKANARGIPAVAAQSFQTGKGEQFMRHEYVGGVWRATATTDSRQPANGFTISAEETPQSVELLRQTFAQGDRTVREMIRQTSAMSISKSEGIPTRRYEP